MSVKCELLKFMSTDGIRHTGLLSKGGSNTTVIHVHGNTGNFYENDFIEHMLERYPEHGINFFTFNSRSHDAIAEGYQNSQLVYLGSALEHSLEDCVYDFEGAIAAVQHLGGRIILQGHSFGCLRVLIYKIIKKDREPFILLSPADSYKLEENFIFPSTITEELNRIKREDLTSTLLPKWTFGVRNRGKAYQIPITGQAFLGLFESPYLELLKYSVPPRDRIDGSALIYYGANDWLQTETKETVQTHLSALISRVEMLIVDEGDHHFHGYENLVIEQICRWIAAL